MDQNRSMSVEKTLAQNLDLLMSARPEFNSQLKLSRASGVGQTTVGRIRRADGAATIDNVEKLAKVFHLRAFELLDPALRARLGHADPEAQASMLATEIAAAGLNASQVTILANTLAAMRSK